MAKKIVIFIVSIAVFGCSKEEDVFLEKFRTLKEMPTSESIKSLKLSDTISQNAISEILIEDVNDRHTRRFTLKKYYYVGKYKLNENFYIICYSIVSRPMDESLNIIAIYNTRKKTITSKLIMESEEYIKRTSEYKDGFIAITSLYVYIPPGKECQPGVDCHSRDTTIEKYKISNDYVFERVN